jgi:hypothetical protein
MSTPESKPRPEFLALAESCGARITGKPDGSEAIQIVFTIDAWRKFDRALTTHPTPAQEAPETQRANENARKLFDEMARTERLTDERDTYRTALEVIALGDCADPVKGATDTLIETGHWRPDAHALARATAPQEAPDPAEVVDSPLLDAARELIAGSEQPRSCADPCYHVPAHLWLTLQGEVMEQLRALARRDLIAIAAQHAAAPPPQEAPAFTYDDMLAYGRLCWWRSRLTKTAGLEPMPAIEDRYNWHDDMAAAPQEAPVSAAHLDRLAQEAPQAETPAGWTRMEDGIPPLGVECLLLVRSAVDDLEPYYKLDTWNTQREAPVSWSSATIETGDCWDETEVEDVIAWAVRPSFATPQPPQEPAGVVPLSDEQIAETIAPHTTKILQAVRTWGDNKIHVYKLATLIEAELRALLSAVRTEPAEPVAWLRDQRDEYEGPATLEPLLLLGALPPGPCRATYSPVYAAPQAEPAGGRVDEREALRHALQEAVDYIHAYPPTNGWGLLDRAGDNEKTAVLELARAALTQKETT